MKVWLDGRIVDGAEGRIEICHVPSGGPENARTIAVAGPSWMAN